jgi:single-stranded-DNA-specific exonuclease
MNRYIARTLPDVAEHELLAYTPLSRKLLLTRNITTAEDAALFLYPNWERDTHDPFQMKDMQKVVDRLFQAIKEKEMIAIWSDYDMDGIPGAVVLYDFFKMLGYENVVHYTPHRNKEGFGLNMQGVDELHLQGVTLMITIDCGITDVECVAYARTKKIDVIITDHHLPQDVLPEAYAILNPKQKDCSYQEKMLCGAGVVFKLVQALVAHLSNTKEMKLHSPKTGWEKWLLDMVGMATVADMVPLLGENRIFAYFGLMVLRKSRRPGLHALLKKARADQRTLTEDDVAFTIAPRINAASRMGHAKDAFKLLSSNETIEAMKLADALDKINNERKTLVAVMKREVKRRIEKNGGPEPVIVLGNPEWKPSLLGLVASSLMEDYGRPIFLWGREGGSDIKGSCRSDGTCNVFDLMSSVSGHFTDFGGHAYSGGFSLAHEQVHTLGNALSEAYMKIVEGETRQKKFYDEVCTIHSVTWDMYREVVKFAPFGQGNPKPVFLFRNEVLRGMRTFGKGGEHLELSFERGDASTVKAISFFTNMDSLSPKVKMNTPITFVAHLEVSNFLGRSELRLRLLEILEN